MSDSVCTRAGSSGLHSLMRGCIVHACHLHLARRVPNLAAFRSQWQPARRFEHHLIPVEPPVAASGFMVLTRARGGATTPAAWFQVQVGTVPGVNERHGPDRSRSPRPISPVTDRHRHGGDMVSSVCLLLLLLLLMIMMMSKQQAARAFVSIDLGRRTAAPRASSGLSQGPSQGPRIDFLPSFRSQPARHNTPPTTVN